MAAPHGAPDREHVAAQPASTVVVVRDTGDRPEVFIVRRHRKAVFASFYVFPGGVVEACDRSVHATADKAVADRADRVLGTSGDGLDYYSAAVRETFEESGVMLARTADGRPAFADLPAADVLQLRRALHAGELGWEELLREHALQPAFDALRYIAYWVTPRGEPRRFATRFFVAALPEGQEARHDEAELVEGHWLSADDALAASRAGELALMPPTRITLESLAPLPSTSAIMAWAERREASGVARILPAFVEVDGRTRIVMPGDPHYPEGDIE